MDLRVSFLGFGVGILVGMTGMGGGALMTPALILFGLARPAVAIGTDLAAGALTKAVGAIIHVRQKTIEYRIVRDLAMGSLPGTVAGLLLLGHLHSRGAEAMDRILVRFLAAALTLAALSLLLGTFRRPSANFWENPRFQQSQVWLTSLVGALIGFLVSLTSVGSGSLIVASLVVLYPTIPMRRIIGSDIFHASLLVGVCSLGHLGVKNVSLPLLASILIGSFPGVWLGSKVGAALPELVLRRVLAAILLFLGYKLI